MDLYARRKSAYEYIKSGLILGKNPQLMRLELLEKFGFPEKFYDTVLTNIKAQAELKKEQLELEVTNEK